MWDKHRNSYICCDICNYIDKTGEALARLVSSPWPVDPDEDCQDTEAFSVCEQRATVVLEVVKRLMSWHRKQELGRLGITTAGVSMAAFRHRGMMHEIDMTDEQEHRDLERAAYHGGRCEALWIGYRAPGVYRPHPLSQYRPGLIHEAPVGPYHLLDASSFYGSIYRDCLLPSKLINYGIWMNEQEASQIIDDESFCAEVTIESPKHCFPVKTDDGLRFACGYYVTTICGPELLRAVQSGCVKKVRKWQRYELLPILKRYAEMLWQERLSASQNGDLVISTWCKQLIAQLHGKFGQRKPEWVVCPDVEPDEPWDKWQHWSPADNRLVQYRAIGTEVQKQQQIADAKICFPAIPAWVAAHGREQLAMWVRLAGNRQTVYVSTDSLIVTDAGLSALRDAGQISDCEMGSLRILESSDRVQIRGVGTLTIGNKIITQGIHHDSEDKVFGTIQETKSTGIEYSINNRGVDVILSTHREVTPAWHYDAARVDDDGWVSPYFLADRKSQWTENQTAMLT